MIYLCILNVLFCLGAALPALHQNPVRRPLTIQTPPVAAQPAVQQIPVQQQRGPAAAQHAQPIQVRPPRPNNSRVANNQAAIVQFPRQVFSFDKQHLIGK